MKFNEQEYKQNEIIFIHLYLLLISNLGYKVNHWSEKFSAVFQLK